MMKTEWTPQTCEELLRNYRPAKIQGSRLQFEGVGDKDVYNITAPFWNEGQWYIAGRVEERESEDSEIVFFKAKQGKDGPWLCDPDLPRFRLQDPFITKINNEWILGGVQLQFSEEPEPKIEGWKTVLYSGSTLHELTHIKSGPWNMKDIRLTELTDGSVGFFSRPFGVEGHIAVIGFNVIKSFEELSETIFLYAHLFRDQFVKEEWGGANEIHMLANGILGVLGHISQRDEDGRLHYHAMAFALNPWTLEKTELKIIAVRSDFPPGPAKRPDLVDVIFSGGLTREEQGRALLYVGASDTEAYRIDIPDPFLEYEKLPVVVPISSV
ncbi:DUF1861 family protein [Saccharibacillus qingshengii]|uniref:DUF1861 family protein n=1 Tax=Saccharibacillus qingshengii TaxID=1763540 RepID=UPI001555624C|nr:DUF1861 family protein [Saccharibacillus qingshengii]